MISITQYFLKEEKNCQKNVKAVKRFELTER